MHGTGTFLRIEEGAVGRLSGYLRKSEGKPEDARHEQREHPACQGALLHASAKGIALFEEDGADGDSGDESGNAQQRVSVAAGKAEDGAPGAAEEDQRAHGGNDAEDEPRDGRRSAARLEFAHGKGHGEGAEDEADDLWTDVLDDACAVQSKAAGNVALKAGHADAHVARVAELLQQNGGRADDEADDNDADVGSKGIFSVHDELLPVCSAFRPRRRTGDVPSECRSRCHPPLHSALRKQLAGIGAATP